MEFPVQTKKNIFNDDFPFEIFNLVSNDQKNHNQNQIYEPTIHKFTLLKIICHRQHSLRFISLSNHSDSNITHVREKKHTEKIYSK